MTLATLLRGWLSVKQGYVEHGIGQLRQGLATQTAMADQQPFVPFLAEVYGKAGQVEKGLGVVAEAIARAHKTGLCFYEAELHRIKGELLLAQEGRNQNAKGKREEVSEAEGCLKKAIEVARSQSAKSLELRAVMSMSRLWQQQGRKNEARQKLAEIYGWFTEGFDTADLKDAKALLEELS
jgi:predicted ATPase